MKRLFTLFLLLFTAIIVCGQTKPFGKVDTTELKMTSCDFEKSANAMVIFDKADVSYKYSSIIMLRHKRIKIFNDNGKKEASVRIEYFGAHNDEEIAEVRAQTINLNNNVIEYTTIDKKLIYTEAVDKNRRALVFTFPNVKAGSVVEFEYKWSTPYPYNYPDWYFQEDIPIRYSELQAVFNKDYTCTVIRKVNQKFFTDTAILLNEKHPYHGEKFIWALNNVRPFKKEPYMTSIKDNIQRIFFQISYRERTWLKICDALVADDDFGKQLNVPLNKEDEVLAKANALKTDDEKIAYIFNLVKDKIVWNKINDFYTYQGIEKAWNKKQGNSTEVNFILYHLLKQAGIDVATLIVNTDGKINPFYASALQLDKTVAYVKLDSTRQYVLDATDKYNVYNQIPGDLLNSNGLYIDVEKKKYLFIPLENKSPARQNVFINAEIKPDGKMSGVASISSSSYNRVNAIRKYKTDGEKKYIDYLRDDDNNLKISSLKLDNMEVDSLPLTQNIDFTLELPGSDENYIYFNPNLFTGLNPNPFISEERFSDIDFGSLNIYTINGRYKVPAGFKIDVLPKSTTMTNGDKTITFKRVVAEQEGYIVLHYILDFKASLYSRDQYPDIRSFYKKMYELLNEQIVLKKA